MSEPLKIVIAHNSNGEVDVISPIPLVYIVCDQTGEEGVYRLTMGVADEDADTVQMYVDIIEEEEEDA